MTWSDELEKDAKTWADFLSANNKFQHGSSGENLYITGSKPSDPCVRATKAFYDEIKDYNFNKPGFSMATGHFTQVSSFILWTFDYVRELSISKAK